MEDFYANQVDEVKSPMKWTGGKFYVADWIVSLNDLYLADEGRGEKVMSKVVDSNVVDYVSKISVMVAEEIRKWSGW
jgi:hypothetical protein